jgi:glycerophosphoryl diester phosphodiesterase family protein
VSATVPLRLRPLEIGDLLDETFRMYRRHFLLFAGLSVILSIPSAALSSFSYYTLFSGLLLQAGTATADQALLQAGTLVLYLVGALIAIALVPFFYGAVTYAACESALGRPVTPAGVLSGVLRRYFPLLGYWLLIGLMLAAFCLIPLWIWIWVGWAVVMPVMFIEKLGLGAAMGRSWRLVQGRWWRTFFTLLLMFIIWFVARTALRAFIVLAQSLLQLVIPTVAALWIAAASSVIVGSLVNPLLQIAIVLIYLDLRVRREALDLFQLAQRVASPQPAQ